jgi:hypothetical protein
VSRAFEQQDLYHTHSCTLQTFTTPTVTRNVRDLECFVRDT